MASIVKTMVFPVVMYGLDYWTINKAECLRSDTSELSCWRRFLRVWWTAARSNKSILKEINPQQSLEGLMLKLKRQYFGHLMWRVGSLDKILMLGKTKSRKRSSQDEMVGWHHWLNGHEFEQIAGDSEGQGSLACCSPWGQKKLDIT